MNLTKVSFTEEYEDKSGDRTAVSLVTCSMEGPLIQIDHEGGRIVASPERMESIFSKVDQVKRLLHRYNEMEPGDCE